MFDYRDNQLYCEDVALADIAARFGTPTWVYSRRAIVSAWHEFADALAHRPVLICYAVKANANLAVLDCLAREGAGFDIVSEGELQRVLAVGGLPERIVFSGVGKSEAGIRRALEVGVRCFNVESEAELQRLDLIARSMGKRAPVSLRVNPDVDAGTHPYISTGLRENKFGIAHERAREVYRIANHLPGLQVVGIDCHIGSQITELAPFLAALDRVVDLFLQVREDGIALTHIDLGGGLGIAYGDDDEPPARAELMRQIDQRLAQRLGETAASVELVFEFGRSIVGSAGLLLSRVLYLKPTAVRNFAIIDAAMNDLLRPSLYGAIHRVLPVEPHPGNGAVPAQEWDLVGPVCESGDWLARNCRLSLGPDDLLGFADAGAYGMVMSSNYNTRARGAEVLVDGRVAHLVREREKLRADDRRRASARILIPRRLSATSDARPAARRAGSRR